MLKPAVDAARMKSLGAASAAHARQLLAARVQRGEADWAWLLVRRHVNLVASEPRVQQGTQANDHPANTHTHTLALARYSRGNSGLRLRPMSIWPFECAALPWLRPQRVDVKFFVQRVRRRELTRDADWPHSAEDAARATASAAAVYAVGAHDERWHTQRTRNTQNAWSSQARVAFSFRCAIRTEPLAVGR